MKFLYDLFPLLLFFTAFKLYDIYVATAVAIVASVIQVTAYWFKQRRFETLHLVTLGAIVVLGGLTLWLRDDTFVKWKPTLVYWVLGAMFLGSHWIGEKTLIERLLGKQLTLPARVWSRQNVSWGVFFLVVGVLNVYVAFYFRPDLDAATRQELWVNFKVFGLLGLTLLFTIAQGVVMARHMPDRPDNGSGKTP